MTTPNLHYQRLCVWSGILWAVLFFAALIMAGQFPPPSPLLSGEQILADVQGRAFLAKASIPIGILAAGLAIPFNALIAGHIARIEARDGSMPLLAISSFGGGMGNIMFFFMVFFPWAGMFYRTDTNPDVAVFINDIVWSIIVMGFSAPALQMVCIALAGFRDTAPNPVFPRWYCFLMLWIATGTCTGCLAIYFFKGPFARDGMIGFWIPAFAFCAWMVTLCYFFLRSIGREERAAA
ncbi:MAG TPA: hypothetical protein VJM11_03575 [Nevskiaceae bacterium]|nr:hypothetical protein [Nevskiaceae bacterium]